MNPPCCLSLDDVRNKLTIGSENVTIGNEALAIGNYPLPEGLKEDRERMEPC